MILIKVGIILIQPLGIPFHGERAQVVVAKGTPPHTHNPNLCIDNLAILLTKAEKNKKLKIINVRL